MSFEVKGHWRNQWDPVLGEWRKRWVETYEKGGTMEKVHVSVDEAEEYLRRNAIGDEMLTFARALVEADAFAGKEDNFLYFLEKPWKWARQLIAWHQAGRPLDASEAGWDLFYEAVAE